jgi:hypothetical protein
LPIFYVNYFKNDNYEYLPISKSQEFPEYIHKMCPNGIDICYQNVLSNGGEVYVSKYYITNNITEWGKTWDELNKNYELLRVADGCYGSCDIFKLSKKNEKN